MVAFDGSPPSEAALRQGVELGEALDTPLVATGVVPTDPLYAREQGWVAPEATYDPGTQVGTFARRLTGRQRRRHRRVEPSLRRVHRPGRHRVRDGSRRTFLSAATDGRAMDEAETTEPDPGHDDGVDAAERPLVAVVMAGGTGTRLYPASHPGREKQFLDFGTGQSLLARTLDRTGFADRTFVLAAPATAERAREEVAAIDHGATVLVEPAARDTGPALVYAAHRVREVVGDCVCCCLPSDHHVGDGFAPTMSRAAGVATEMGGLVLLGIEPDSAATGYGYLKPGDDRGGYHTVERFYEKPDPGAAARYRQSGYLWNAGTFAWTPEALLDAARDSPLEPLVQACERGVPEAGYGEVEAVSIDHAVLERHGGASDEEGEHEVVVVPAEFDWDDLGTWDALDTLLDADGDGNVVGGDGGTLAVDSEGCTLAAGESAHVAVVDCEDLVVATYDGRTLVLPERRADRVREVVEELRERGEYPGIEE